MDNRESATARDKKERRLISTEGKHENFISVVRKREILEATKGKVSGSEEYSEKEFIPHFLNRTCIN